MSAIGGLGSSSNLYQYLQSLNSSPVTHTSAPQTVGVVDSDGASNGSGTTQSTTSTSNTTGASSAASGAASLVQQLETAIQNALNGVSSSQNNAPQAALSAVEQAVQSTLQQNGIDPSQLSQPGGHHGHHGGHHHGGGGGSAGGVLAAPNSNSGSSSTGSDSSTSGNAFTNSQTPGLNSLLTQLNIDPQQFRNDIISALVGSQNGTIDPSQVFQSFPTGQNVNVLT